MAITCDYAAPDNLTVNYRPDANSVTVLPANEQRVLDFVNGGGVIGAYVAPPAPPTTDQLDIATINRELAAPGSIVRALALTMLSELNILRVQAGLQPRTQPQLVAALKAQIR